MEHPWILTSPWYRWGDPSTPRRADTGRMTRPELQMYGMPDYVNAFLAEPQRYLKPRDDKDFVHRSVVRDGVQDPKAKNVWRPYLRRATGIRKLFLPIHSRYYLVVVELHCDRPGLPRVGRDEVGDAGFVIRRRPVGVDPETETRARKALSQIAMVKERLEYQARRKTKAKAIAPAPPAGIMRRAIRSAAEIVRTHELQRPMMLEQELLLERWQKHEVELKELVAGQTHALKTEGWFPDPNDEMRGRWTQLDKVTPARDLEGEHVYPLQPLIPDPNDPDHSARGRTIYFGVVPVGAAEQESTGAPRFDGRHLFELRCFVRRAHERPECGKLVWSLPTQGYQIAMAGDLDGTVNNPVTIEFPNFSDLQARADELTTGAAGGVRVVTPPDSRLPFTRTPWDGLGNLAPKDSNGFGSICFFAIILIFIIAFFVMILFLPIVIFVFQLWFMLRLKFCIPPSIDVGLGLAIDLKVAVDIKVELEAALDAGVDVQFEAEAVQEIDRGLALVFPDPDPPPPPVLHPEIAKLSLIHRAQLYVDAVTDFRHSLDPEIRAQLGLGEPGTEEALYGTLPGAGLQEDDYYPVIPWREAFA